MTLAQPADHRPWLRAPAEAHSDWIAGMRPLGNERAYAEHTLEQYRSVFRRFCEWMAGQQLNLRQLREDDLRRFLDSLRNRSGHNVAGPKTRRMYLAEIDRVLAYLELSGMVRSNVARALVQEYKITDKLQPRVISLPTEGFDERLRERVRGFLAQARERDMLAPLPLRDVAMVVLMFKAGLTPKELQKLRLKDLRPVPGFDVAQRVRLEAEGHRLLKGRDVELEGWAAECIVRWWQLRSAQVLGRGATVDEARDAKTFSHPAKERALDSTVIYQATRALCADCGSPAAGPQMLRNGFIAELIKRDVPDDEVAARAGLRVNDQVIQVRNALDKGYKRGPKPRRARAAA